MENFSGDIMDSGFPTKPQIARSATSRDAKNLKLAAGGSHDEDTPEDLPIDEVIISSLSFVPKLKILNPIFGRVLEGSLGYFLFMFPKLCV